MYSYCVSLWLARLTTTPHYWPLHYATLWCGWTTMTRKERSFLRPKTLFLKDSSLVCSVANWCSIKHERMVLPLSLKMIPLSWETLTFSPYQWRVRTYRERTFVTTGSILSLTRPFFAQNSLCSTALWLFQAVFLRVWTMLCFFRLTSQSCKCGGQSILKKTKKKKSQC